MTAQPLTTSPAPSPAVRLLTAWERADGRHARRPSVSLQLAVVQYCTDRPGTPVPTLDDMEAVRALVGSLRRYRVRYHSTANPWGVWDNVALRFVAVSAGEDVRALSQHCADLNRANA
jgi:hypothetical protein